MTIPGPCAKSLALIFLVCQFAANGWAQTHSTGSGQAYPVKPVRLVSPGTAGSGADTLARLVAGGLPQAFGQQVIVDNRPGANGIIGADIVAKSPPDGYTWLLANIAHAANVSIYSKLPYDLLRDLAPLTQVAASPHVVVVHPSLPVKSVNELVKLAKAKPGAINYASAGTGSSTFLATELLKGQTGINMVHVPYKGGGPSLNSVVAGETAVYFSPFAVALPHIRAGRLRALAMTTAKRVSLMPELPTVAESGYPGYEFANWYGLLVPAKTPKETIAAIRGAVVTVLKEADVSKRLAALSYIPVGDEPEEFGVYIKSEVDKLATLVRKLNLTAEAIK